MAVLTDDQLSAAEARGRDILRASPRAVQARYDMASGRVVLEFANGCAYAFPAELAEDLKGAGAEALSEVQVDGAGYNLNWPALDADLYVPALLAGIFGTQAWMTRELARRAGRTTSPSKAAAARANGAKGGRPRKSA